MARVTYKPGLGDPASTSWGGHSFEANKAVEVKNPALLAKAQNNPFFEVSAAKEEQRQAEVIGGYADANTGDEVALVRTRRTMSYGVMPSGPTGPLPPSAATQGSTATRSDADDTFEEVYGATREEIASGEYEGAPEPVGEPVGTAAAAPRRGRPPKK
jgi:hypothetical protein